jgi:hypothetical protein
MEGSTSITKRSLPAIKQLRAFALEYCANVCGHLSKLFLAQIQRGQTHKRTYVRSE